MGLKRLSLILNVIGCIMNTMLNVHMLYILESSCHSLTGNLKLTKQHYSVPSVGMMHAIISSTFS